MTTIIALGLLAAAFGFFFWEVNKQAAQAEKELDEARNSNKS
jgi:hypothetical protein